MSFLFDPIHVQALGFALVSFLWQGALAAGVLAGASALFARRSPEARYALACLTLLLMLAAPVVTLLGITRGTPPLGPTTSAEGPSMAPRTTAEPPLALVRGSFSDRVGGALPIFVTLWCAGVLLLSLRSLGGWVLAQRLKRSGTSLAALEGHLSELAERLRVSRPVRLCQSALVAVPTVIGWIRPVILLPASAVSGLSPEQLELILAHELVHIRRYDYLVSVLQAAIETLLFYHPAVWWVSHRIRVERELCCDDQAVATFGNALVYARALAELETLRAEVPMFVLAANGGSLLERVRRIVGEPVHASRSSRGLAALLALGTAGIALTAGSLLARSDERWPSQKAVIAEDVVPPKASDPPPAPEEPPKPSGPQKATAQKRAFPLEKILELTRAGVTPEWLDEMAAAGYPSLSIEQVVELRQQGVSPEYVKAMRDAGYPKLTPSELLALRGQGVGPEYVAGMAALGLGTLTVSDLIELREQGVSPEFVKQMKDGGYGSSVPQLIELRSQGVTPHFASEMKALGYERLSAIRLIALRSQGVTPEFVRELRALGLTDLSVSMLIALRNQGVTPEFVREMKAVGYGALAVGDLIALRQQGVTAEYVREMKEGGYDALAVSELIALRAQGVSGEFVREMKAAGLGHLSVDELIELRSNGVRGKLLERLRGRQ
jgi:beta-lactamase regulating signal transducer with metallopeptidase domain